MRSYTTLALSLTLLTWASAFAGIRAAMVAYSPWQVAFVRFLLASVIFAAYAAWRRVPAPKREDMPGIVLVGLLGVPVYHVALNLGERTVSAGAASLLIATTPIFTAVWAHLFLRDRLTRRRIAGIGVSFIGAALIAWGEARGHAAGALSGALWVLFAAVGWSVNIVLQKRLLARYGALRVTIYSVWAGTAFLLPVAWGLPATAARAPVAATLALLYLGIFPAAMAYLAWAYVLARVSAARTASYLYLNPVLAVAIGWLWLGEVPALLSVFGGLLALGGVVVTNAGAVRKP